MDGNVEYTIDGAMLPLVTASNFLGSPIASAMLIATIVPGTAAPKMIGQQYSADPTSLQ